MSDLLSIGASGVRAYQSALGTVSDNIANANTPGYTRRATSLTEVISASGSLTQARVIEQNGVNATGVSRSADAYQAAAVRVSGSDLARTQTAATWLTQVQGALTGNNLGDRLTGFFAAATTLSADPTSTATRSAMLEAGTSVANAFSGTGRALDQAASDLDGTADDAAAKLNALGAALAKVNDGLGRVASGSAAAAGLADQRDQLLDEMSAVSDINVQTDALGRASVRVGGASGATLVANGDAGTLTYARSDTGTVSFAVHLDGQTSTATPTGGALAGVADAASRIVDARDALNQLATQFSTGVNAVQAAGQDANGQAGAAMFATGATPTDLTLSLTDPAGVAAASNGDGVRDNTNLASLAALRQSGGFEGKVTDLVSDTAAALSAKQTVAAAQTSIHDGAVATRDAVSGVNLDNEAVDLLRFQQAYSASSRVIQVARDTLQSILDIH